MRTVEDAKRAAAAKIEQKMRVAIARIDERIAEAMDQSERILREHGATVDEIDAELDRQREELWACRSQFLAELKHEMLALLGGQVDAKQPVSIATAPGTRRRH